MSNVTSDYNSCTEKSGKKNSDIPQYTLRVRGKSNDPSRSATDPVGLSRSILHTLRQNPDGWCDVQCVGQEAFWRGNYAFRLANAEVKKRTNRSQLVQDQSEYTAEIAGKTALGICIHIYPVLVKDIILK